MSASDVVAAGAVAVAVTSAVLTYRSARRASDVNQQDADTKRAAELRADAAEARTDARQARQEAAGARQQATAAHVQAGEAHRRMEEVVAYLGWIIRTIHEPGMTMDRLRDLVGDSRPPLSASRRPDL